MSDLPAPADTPRARLLGEILEAARTGSPRIQVVTGPRGLGKTELLGGLARLLGARGPVAAQVDFERLCTIPTDFAEQFVAAVAAGARRAGRAPGARAEHLARSLAEEASRTRPDAGFLFDGALAYPQALAEDLGAPVVLLVDEIGEIQRLGRHSGLRDCLDRVAGALAGSGLVRVVGAASHASRPGPLLRRLADRWGGDLRLSELPPMGPEEIARCLPAWGCAAAERSGSPQAWMNATAGRPLYARVLARRCGAGAPLEEALEREMAPPSGLLHLECRFDYHILIERSRGQAAVRTILGLIAREQGCVLSRIARHLRVALPTALDYLSWLLEVGLIVRHGAAYRCADPLLGLWIGLRAAPEEEAGRLVADFLRRPTAAPASPHRPRGRRPGRTGAAAPRETVPPASPVSPPEDERRSDFLIEID